MSELEIDAGGVRLSGSEDGDGVPVVLLHGLTATRRYVVMGSRNLARDGHRVIAYDARGTIKARYKPATAPLFRRAGYIRANRENAAKALRTGGVVVVFPGGDYDAYRPTLSENVIDFNGRKGYVSTAIDASAVSRKMALAPPSLITTRVRDSTVLTISFSNRTEICISPIRRLACPRHSTIRKKSFPSREFIAWPATAS